MSDIVESARAKINLTLRVQGRRQDGYHELESLVAFADIGDRLTLRRTEPASALDPASVDEQRLTVSGPFACDIVGNNLVAAALDLVEAALGAPLDVAVQLEKHLPVASGIGGGSADAAAALRALQRMLPQREGELDWMALAGRLGADMPVCFASRSVVMTGTGERLAPVAFPAVHAVLANPCVAVPSDKSRRVFAALGAPILDAAHLRGIQPPPVPVLPDWRAVVELARRVGNDLEAAATAVIPAIAEVKAAVAASRDCRHALLSGAGPTVVGLYASAEAARGAAHELAAEHPAWWVRAAVIGG